jgi:hypothetical protein
MFFSKMIAPIAFALAFVGSAQGCLEVKGRAQQGPFSEDVDFVVIDNGLQVCTFSGGGQGTATCLLNYHMHFDYSDNPREGPMPMTYHNPVTGPYELRVPLSCFINGQCCREYYFIYFNRARRILTPLQPPGVRRAVATTALSMPSSSAEGCG